MKRTDERNEFLTDVLITACEHDGYGFFDLIEYQHDAPPGKAYALITEREGYEGEDGRKEYRLDVDVIAAGIGVIRNAVLRVPEGGQGDGEEVLHNAATGQRLYLFVGSRKVILACSDENDAPALDVVEALAIVECALFGQVAFA